MRFGDADVADDDDDVFTFSSGHVFNMLMQFCLSNMDELLRRHVAGGKAKADAAPKNKAGIVR